MHRLHTGCVNCLTIHFDTSYPRLLIVNLRYDSKYTLKISATYTFIVFLVLTILLTALPDSLRVVKTLTGLLAFTARASFITRWLRRVPVRRDEVRFLGLPIYTLLLSACN